MYAILQYISWAIGVLLNVLVIHALLRGSYRRYPVALAYAVGLLLATIAEITASSGLRSFRRSVYWFDEVILDILVYCVVIAFIDHAAAEAPRKPLKRRWLATGAAAILALSLLLHGGTPNRRMTLVSRDLNIVAVILDLILWSLLIAARRPNRCLLLLSGGLGLQLTGAIMGESLRSLSPHALLPGTLLEVITSFIGLYIWWQAFRADAVR